MDLKLAGRRALVLGGNRGMGLAIATALAGEGAAVAIAARDPVRLEAARAELGPGAMAFPLDLGDTAGLPAFATGVTEAFGAPEILINNTGGPPYGAAGGRGIEEWQSSFQEMALSVIALTDAFLPAMRAARWGRIVTIVSSGAVQPVPVLGISNALRAALIGWSKTLAGEVAAEGVTVNVLVPGRIATERVFLTDQAAAQRQGLDPAEIQRRSEATIPVGRYGRPEEVADMVTFLASPRAAYMTGAMIRVDGGIIRHV